MPVNGGNATKLTQIGAGVGKKGDKNICCRPQRTDREGHGQCGNKSTKEKKGTRNAERESKLVAGRDGVVDKRLSNKPKGNRQRTAGERGVNRTRWGGMEGH